MKVRVVSNYAEIQDLVNKTKKPGFCFLTNFYTDESKINFWIDHGVLSIVENEGTSFILRKHMDFHYLYFLSSGIENLEHALKLLIREISKVYVVDLVEKGDEPSLLLSLFKRNHFSYHETLIRMIMKRSSELSYGVNAGEQVHISQVDPFMIFQFLTQRLDRYSEQIPTEEEIKMMIQRNQLLILKEEDEIGGILYFEKSGATSHLKEWLVNERFRDKHFGSRLINQYFFLCNDCSRFILWVKKHNDHAIEIYKHYGYSAEKINDRILVSM